MRGPTSQRMFSMGPSVGGVMREDSLAAPEAESQAQSFDEMDDGAHEEAPPPPPPAPMMSAPQSQANAGPTGFFGRMKDAAASILPTGGAKAAPAPAPSEKKKEEDPMRRSVAKQVLDTAAELEKMIKGRDNRPPPAPLVTSDSTNTGAGPAAERLLYVVDVEGQMIQVAKDRFLIGRGKHCDMVINSGKVSREHAAIVRDGNDFFIEDLGSSNKTWFNKVALTKRRKIDDGDEYFICSEKIRCLYR